MTHEELQAIKARAEAATPGPWRSGGAAGLFGAGDEPVLGLPMNVDFVINARTDVPNLVAEVERLRELSQRRLEMYEECSQELRTYLNKLHAAEIEIHQLKQGMK